MSGRKKCGKCLGLLLAICVSVAVAVSPAVASTALAGTPEIAYENGVPVLPGVASVFVLQGSDYDIGYQYAQQFVHTYGAQMLEPLKRTFTDEQLKALKAYQWYIAKYTPEMIDQFRGMADGATDAGATLSYAEVLANFTGVTSYPGTEPAGSQDDSLPFGGCSGFAAWGSTTKDGKLITSGSSDAEPGFNYAILVYPKTGNNYTVNWATMYKHFMGFAAGTIHPAMNNKGLSFVHHGSLQPGNEKQGYAVPRTLATLHTLRFADNVAEAVKMQLSYPPGTLQGGLWADTTGAAANIDCRNPKLVRHAGQNGERDFLYATNNCLTKKITPTKETAWLASAYGWKIRYVKHGGWTAMDEDAVRRNLLIYNMLSNYHGKVDVSFVKMMWRFAGRMPKYPSLEAADAGMYKNQSAGWDSKICALGNAFVGICQPDRGDNGVLYACLGPATRQANAQCPDYTYFIPEAAHTFFEVRLAASPTDSVSEARRRASYDLAYANLKLRRLDYSDSAFAPLDDLFNKAVKAWYKGEYYLSLAERSTGNASVCNYGRSLSGFAQCQCLAQQVKEALSPAPDTPTDLGLRKYWGQWGVWSSYLGSH